MLMCVFITEMIPSAVSSCIKARTPLSTFTRIGKMYFSKLRNVFVERAKCISQPRRTNIDSKSMASDRLEVSSCIKARSGMIINLITAVTDQRCTTDFTATIASRGQTNLLPGKRRCIEFSDLFCNNFFGKTLLCH